MADLTLFESLNGGDVEIIGNNIPLTDAIFNQIYMGLFGGNVAQSTQDVSADQDQRFDYFANDLLFADSPESQFNSSFERLLSNTSLNSSGLRSLEEAALKDLSFMKGLAEISVDISLDGNDRIQIDILAQEPDSLQEKSFTIIWDATRAEDIQSAATSEESDPPPSFDPDAQSWIDDINAQAAIGAVDVLTVPQESAINTYVLALKANSLFDKIYYHAIQAFGESRGIVDIFGKVGAPTGGGLWDEGIGWIGNGTNSEIATGYIANTDDPLIADDALSHVYIQDFTATGNQQVALGANDLAFRLRCPRIENFGSPNLTFSLGTNTGSARVPNDPVAGVATYSVTNIGETKTDYQNEVSIGTQSAGTWGASPSEVFIGSENGVRFLNATVKSVLIAQATGFDQGLFRTNLDILLAAFEP